MGCHVKPVIAGVNLKALKKLYVGGMNPVTRKDAVAWVVRTTLTWLKSLK